MAVVTQPNRLIVMLAALVAIAPLSIDMYLPSLPLIARDLLSLKGAAWVLSLMHSMTLIAP
jgi:hypothetical protein